MVHPVLRAENNAPLSPASQWALATQGAEREALWQASRALRDTVGELPSYRNEEFEKSRESPQRKAKIKEAQAAVKAILTAAKDAGWPAGWAAPQTLFDGFPERGAGDWRASHGARDGSERDRHWHPLELSKLCHWGTAAAWSFERDSLERWRLAVHALGTGFLGEETLLHVAVREEPGSKTPRGQDPEKLTERAKRLMAAWQKAGGSLETKDSDHGMEPIHMALADLGVEPRAACVEALIQAGVSLSRKDRNKNSVMLLAAGACSSPELLRRLLAAGASILGPSPALADSQETLEALQANHGRALTMELLADELGRRKLPTVKKAIGDILRDGSWEPEADALRLLEAQLEAKSIKASIAPAVKAGSPAAKRRPAKRV